MKFSFFHLMPYTGLADVSGDWPVPNRVFDPEKAREYYRAYVDTMMVGNLPDAVVRKGMALFRDRVLPEVRGL